MDITATRGNRGKIPPRLRYSKYDSSGTLTVKYTQQYIPTESEIVHFEITTTSPDEITSKTTQFDAVILRRYTNRRRDVFAEAEVAVQFNGALPFWSISCITTYADTSVSVISGKVGSDTIIHNPPQISYVSPTIVAGEFRATYAQTFPSSYGDTHDILHAELILRDITDTAHKYIYDISSVDMIMEEPGKVSANVIFQNIDILRRYYISATTYFQDGTSKSTFNTEIITGFEAPQLTFGQTDATTVNVTWSQRIPRGISHTSITMFNITSTTNIPGVPSVSMPYHTIYTRSEFEQEKITFDYDDTTRIASYTVNNIIPLLFSNRTDLPVLNVSAITYFNIRNIEYDDAIHGPITPYIMGTQHIDPLLSLQQTNENAINVVLSIIFPAYYTQSDASSAIITLVNRDDQTTYSSYISSFEFAAPPLYTNSSVVMDVSNGTYDATAVVTFTDGETRTATDSIIMEPLHYKPTMSLTERMNSIYAVRVALNQTVPSFFTDDTTIQKYDVEVFQNGELTTSFLDISYGYSDDGTVVVNYQNVDITLRSLQIRDSYTVIGRTTFGSGISLTSDPLVFSPLPPDKVKPTITPSWIASDYGMLWIRVEQITNNNVPDGGYATTGVITITQQSTPPISKTIPFTYARTVVTEAYSVYGNSILIDISGFYHNMTYTLSVTSTIEYIADVTFDTRTYTITSNPYTFTNDYILFNQLAAASSPATTLQDNSWRYEAAQLYLSLRQQIFHRVAFTFDPSPVYTPDLESITDITLEITGASSDVSGQYSLTPTFELGNDEIWYATIGQTIDISDKFSIGDTITPTVIITYRDGLKVSKILSLTTLSNEPSPFISAVRNFLANSPMTQTLRGSITPYFGIEAISDRTQIITTAAGITATEESEIIAALTTAATDQESCIALLWYVAGVNNISAIIAALPIVKGYDLIYTVANAVASVGTPTAQTLSLYNMSVSFDAPMIPDYPHFTGDNAGVTIIPATNSLTGLLHIYVDQIDSASNITAYTGSLPAGSTIRIAFTHPYLENAISSITVPVSGFNTRTLAALATNVTSADEVTPVRLASSKNYIPPDTLKSFSLSQLLIPNDNIHIDDNSLPAGCEVICENLTHLTNARFRIIITADSSGNTGGYYFTKGIPYLYQNLRADNWASIIPQRWWHQGRVPVSLEFSSLASRIRDGGLELDTRYYDNGNKILMLSINKKTTGARIEKIDQNQPIYMRAFTSELNSSYLCLCDMSGLNVIIDASDNTIIRANSLGERCNVTYNYSTWLENATITTTIGKNNTGTITVDFTAGYFGTAQISRKNSAQPIYIISGKTIPTNGLISTNLTAISLYSDSTILRTNSLPTGCAVTYDSHSYFTNLSSLTIPYNSTSRTGSLILTNSMAPLRLTNGTTSLPNYFLYSIVSPASFTIIIPSSSFSLGIYSLPPGCTVIQEGIDFLENVDNITYTIPESYANVHIPYGGAITLTNASLPVRLSVGRSLPANYLREVTTIPGNIIVTESNTSTFGSNSLPVGCHVRYEGLTFLRNVSSLTFTVPSGSWNGLPVNGILNKSVLAEPFTVSGSAIPANFLRSTNITDIDIPTEQINIETNSLPAGCNVHVKGISYMNNIGDLTWSIPESWSATPTNAVVTAIDPTRTIALKSSATSFPNNYWRSTNLYSLIVPQALALTGLVFTVGSLPTAFQNFVYSGSEDDLENVWSIFPKASYQDPFTGEINPNTDLYAFRLLNQMYQTPINLTIKDATAPVYVRSSVSRLAAGGFLASTTATMVKFRLTNAIDECTIEEGALPSGIKIAMENGDDSTDYLIFNFNAFRAMFKAHTDVIDERYDQYFSKSQQQGALKLVRYSGIFYLCTTSSEHHYRYGMLPVWVPKSLRRSGTLTPQELWVPPFAVTNFIASWDLSGLQANWASTWNNVDKVWLPGIPDSTEIYGPSIESVAKINTSEGETRYTLNGHFYENYYIHDTQFGLLSSGNFLPVGAKLEYAGITYVNANGVIDYNSVPTNLSGTVKLLATPTLRTLPPSFASYTHSNGIPKITNLIISQYIRFNNTDLPENQVYTYWGVKWRNSRTANASRILELEPSITAPEGKWLFSTKYITDATYQIVFNNFSSLYPTLLANTNNRFYQFYAAENAPDVRWFGMERQMSCIRSRAHAISSGWPSGNILSQPNYSTWVQLQDVIDVHYRQQINTAIAPVVASSASIASVPINCFKDMTSLTGGAIKPITVSERAFDGCTNLNKWKHAGYDIYSYGYTYAPFSIDTSDTTHVGQHAFRNCIYLQSIRLPTPCTVGLGAYSGCASLNSALINCRGKTQIDSSALEGCNALENLTLYGLTNPLPWLSRHISLKTLFLEFVGTVTLDNFTALTKLETLELSGGTITLAANSFAGLPVLRSVVMSGSGKLTGLGAAAFTGCTALTTLALSFVDNATSAASFATLPALRTVTFVCNALSMPENLFADCSSLSSLVVNGTLSSSVGSAGLQNCNSLTTLSIDFTTNQADRQFRNYLSSPCLQVVSLTGGVVIENFDFAANSKGTLQHLTVNRFSSNIFSDWLFQGYTALRSFTLQASPTSIGEGCFFGCRSLNSFSFAEGLTKIDNYAFADTDISGDVVIPSSVTYLGKGYFLGCKNLNRVTYKCPTLFFIDPTNVHGNIWNDFNKPVNSTYTINGPAVLNLNRDNSGGFTYSTAGSSITVPNSSLRCFMSKTKYKERLNKFSQLYESIAHIIRATPKDASGNITDVSGYQIFKGLSHKIKGRANLAVSLHRPLTELASNIDFNTTTGSFFCDIAGQSYQTTAASWGALSALNNAQTQAVELLTIDNTLLTSTITGADTLISTQPYSFPHSSISLTLPTSIIHTVASNDISNSAIYIQNEKPYMKYVDDSISLVLTDGTYIDISGTLLYDITANLGVNAANLIRYYWANIDTNENNSVKFTFENESTSILSIIGKNGSAIDISADTVFLYDRALVMNMDTTVSITAKNLVIYDEVFNDTSGGAVTINITDASSDVVCGRNIFEDSNAVTLTTNRDLLNFPRVLMVSLEGKTLCDISGLFSEAFGINLEWTRNMEYATYMPPGGDGNTPGYPMLTCQSLLDMQYYTILGQPEDWFWCFAGTHPGGYYDMDNNLSYTATTERDRYGNEEETYMGLSHSFAPDVINIYGYRFVRETTRSSTQNTYLRALKTDNDDSKSRRQEQTGTNAILQGAVQILLAIVTLGIGAAISAVVSSAVTAGTIAATTARIISNTVTVVLALVESVSSFLINAAIDNKTFKFGTEEGELSALDFGLEVGLASVVHLGGIASSLRKSIKLNKIPLLSSTPGIKYGSNVDDIASALSYARKRPAPTVRTKPIKSNVKSKSIAQPAAIRETAGTRIKKSFGPTKIRTEKPTQPIVQRSASRQPDPPVVDPPTPENPVNPISDIVTNPPAAPPVPVGTRAISGSSSTSGSVYFRNGAPVVVEGGAGPGKYVKINGKWVTIRSYSQIYQELVELFDYYFNNTSKTLNTLPTWSQLITDVYPMLSTATNTEKCTVFASLYAAYIEDITGITESLNIINYYKTTNSTLYDLSGVHFNELATFCANSSLLELTSSGDLRFANITSETITNIVHTAAVVPVPQMIYPRSSAPYYDNSHYKDNIQYFLQRSNNWVDRNDAPKDYMFDRMENGYPMIVMPTASPLHARREYIWKDVYLGERTGVNNRETAKKVGYSKLIDGDIVLGATYFRDEIYLGNRLVEYNLPENPEVANTVFAGAKNFTIHISEGVTKITSNSFASADETYGVSSFTISSIYLPSTLTDISNNAFIGTSVNNMYQNGQTLFSTENITPSTIQIYTKPTTIIDVQGDSAFITNFNYAVINGNTYSGQLLNGVNTSLRISSCTLYQTKLPNISSLQVFTYDSNYVIKPASTINNTGVAVFTRSSQLSGVTTLKGTAQDLMIDNFESLSVITGTANLSSPWLLRSSPPFIYPPPPNVDLQSLVSPSLPCRLEPGGVIIFDTTYSNNLGTCSIQIISPRSISIPREINPYQFNFTDITSPTSMFALSTFILNRGSSVYLFAREASNSKIVRFYPAGAQQQNNLISDSYVNIIAAANINKARSLALTGSSNAGVPNISVMGLSPGVRYFMITQAGPQPQRALNLRLEDDIGCDVPISVIKHGNRISPVTQQISDGNTCFREFTINTVSVTGPLVYLPAPAVATVFATPVDPESIVSIVYPSTFKNGRNNVKVTVVASNGITITETVVTVIVG